jgi:hypothetical protein
MNFWLGSIHAREPISMLIHGGARGADKMAGRWAYHKGIHAAEVCALWDAFGKAAGHRRNEAMLELGPTLVIAFQGGKGTQSMIDIAEKARVKIIHAYGWPE